MVGTRWCDGRDGGVKTTQTWVGFVLSLCMERCRTRHSMRGGGWNMKTGILMVHREYRNSMQKGGSGWASKNNGGGGQPCKNNGGGLIVAKRARGCLAMQKRWQWASVLPKGAGGGRCKNDGSGPHFSAKMG